MTEPGSAPARRSFNHLAWIAPLVAVFGLLSYFMYFSMWPVFRDFPWLNLLILGGSVVLGGLALGRTRGPWGRVGAAAGLFVAVALTGLLCFYAFHLSYELPDAGRVVGEGTEIPAISLASWDGETIDLGEAARGADGDLILVFYRGYW